MQKQQFTDGTPITPEWLNAIQNPTFDGSNEDVGHLPLPPNYAEKQQCQTIHVAGASNTVDLDNWPYNAVILVRKRMIVDKPEYPRNLTVRCSNSTGAIIVIPELDQNGILTISMVGAGASETATVEVKRGDIVIMNAFDTVDEVETRIRKIQTGDTVEFRNVLSNIFSICKDDNKAIVYLDSQYNLVVAKSQNSTIPLFSVQLPLKVPSIECGKLNESGFFKVTADNDKSSIKFRGPNQFGDQFLEYSTEDGRFYQGHSYENDIDTIEAANATVDLHKKHGNYGAETHILFNKNVNDSLSIVEETGCICLYKNLHGAAPSQFPQKTVIRADGISCYNYIGNQWVGVSQA